MRFFLFYYCYRGSLVKIFEFYFYVYFRRGLGWWWFGCGLRKFMVFLSILGDCFNVIYFCILFLKDIGIGDFLFWV